jgi:hypothetical protein
VNLEKKILPEYDMVILADPLDGFSTYKQACHSLTGIPLMLFLPM